MACEKEPEASFSISPAAPNILKRSARLIVTGMMKVIFTLSAAWCLAVFPALGQDVPPAFERAENAEEQELEEAGYDPFDPGLYAPKLVRVQIEHIDVSHKDLTRLMMEDNVVLSNAKGLRMKVQELVEKDAAKVFETQILVCRSGQKCTTESIHEFMYPTEYEPPEPPPSDDDKEKEKVPPPSYPFNPATPTSFETKNIGSTMEIEPTIGENDQIIDLRFLPELTWHTGNTVWSEIKDKQGNVNKVAMPDFYKLSINTSITCIPGQYVMVGALSPKNEKGEVDRDRKIMIFVKCDILAQSLREN